MASSKLSLEFPIASSNIGGFDWCCLSFGKSTVCYGISAFLIVVESSKKGPSIPLAIATWNYQRLCLIDQVGLTTSTTKRIWLGNTFSVSSSRASSSWTAGRNQRGTSLLKLPRASRSAKWLRMAQAEIGTPSRWFQNEVSEVMRWGNLLSLSLEKSKAMVTWGHANISIASILVVPSGKLTVCYWRWP